MKAFHFDGDNGEDIREEEIPADRLEECKTAPPRDDRGRSPITTTSIAEKFLDEQEPNVEELRAAIRTRRPSRSR